MLHEFKQLKHLNNKHISAIVCQCQATAGGLYHSPSKHAIYSRYVNSDKVLKVQHPEYMLFCRLHANVIRHTGAPHQTFCHFAVETDIYV